MSLNPISFNTSAGSVPPKQVNDSTIDSGKESNESTAATIMSSSINYVHRPKYDLSVAQEAVVKAIEQINKALDGREKRFEYSVHKKTGDIMVKIIDKNTNEVIREIPPEKIVDLVVKLQEISGFIIDEKR